MKIPLQNSPVSRSLARVLAFLKRKPRAVVSYQIVPRDIFRLSLSEWRQSPELVKQASQALANPVVRNMADVLRNEHLGNYSSAVPMSSEDRAIICARAEGYGICLNNLEAMSTIEKPKESIEATFEREQIE